jgi:hypothetical protein
MIHVQMAHRLEPVLMYKSLDLILRTMSDLTIHLTADIIGEADSMLSMTALQAAAGGGRKAIIDNIDPLAKLAAKTRDEWQAVSSSGSG